MAKASFVADLADVSSGDQTIRASWTITTPLQQELKATFASGDNTVTWPAGATMLLLLPGPGETVVITLKGAGGDTGIPISVTQPTIITKTSAANIIINASGTGTATWTLKFI